MQNWRFLKDAQGDPNAVYLPDSPADLIGRPKLKFLWTVNFEFREDFPESFKRESGGTFSQLTNPLPIKAATRPNPTINYSDANFYGVRTKVATKTDFGQATITMYDDVKNRAHDILELYLKAVSPSTGTPQGDALYYEPFTYSTIGALAEQSQLGLFTKINVRHYYISDAGYEYINYGYINPKIVNFTFDDLDMTVSEASTISLTFNFDTVTISRGFSD